jgi:negative regulator of sigma E activity
MDKFDDTEIARLLRLKRYEQPPPGYFENFLHEFHKRQRDELLKQPVWRIALDRAQDFMCRLNVPTLSSGPVAVAAMLIFAALISLKMYQAPNESTQPVAMEQAAAVSAPGVSQTTWSLSKPIAASRELDSAVFRNVKASQTHRPVAAPTRYVLDSTPVSYEPALRF